MKWHLIGCALLSLVAIVAAAGSWQDLLVVDCNGGVQVTPSLGLTNLKMFAPSMVRAYRAYYDMMFDRVSCKCPSVTAEQFERLFFPSVAFGLNMLAGPNADISMPTGCTHADFRNITMAGFAWNYTTNAFGPTLGVPFALPSTCTYTSWKTNGECKMQWSLPSTMSMNLELMVKKCPNSPWPFMSVSCSGAACATALMPCDTNTDCGTGMKCQTLKSSSTNTLISSGDMVNILNSFSLSDTCRSPAQIMTPFFNIVRKFFDGHTVTHGTSELRVCLPNGAPTAPGSTFQQISDAFIPADACSVPFYESCTTYYNSIYDSSTGQWVENRDSNWTSCTNRTLLVDCVAPTNAALRTWNGVMSTGESAASPARMLGAASPAKVPRPLTPGAKVVMYTDCATSDMHFFPSSNFLPLFGSLKSTADLVNTLWSSLRTSANCATGNTINEDTFRVKWSALWDFLLYYFTKPTGTAIQNISQGWSSSSTGFLNMPATCTYEQWRTKGSCSAKFTGLSDLFGVETVLQVRTRKCPAVGPYAVPEVYMECVGAGCAVLDSIKPCSTNADCVNGLVCQDLTALWNKMGITSDIFADLFWPYRGYNSYDGGSCRSVPKAYENLRKMLLTLTGNDISSASSKTVCMHSVSHMSSVVNTWANSLATTDAGVTTIKQLYAWAAPLTDVVIGDPRPEATLTITVSSTTAPTQTQLDAIAQNIASVFGIDVSLVKVYFNPKKRAIYDIVVEFYAAQVVGTIANVATSTALQTSIKSAVSTATGQSMQVESVSAALAPAEVVPEAATVAPVMPPSSAPSLSVSHSVFMSIVAVLFAVVAIL